MSINITNIEQVQECFKTLQWPTSAHEKWTRSDPEAIPFGLLTDVVSENEKQVAENIHRQIEDQLTSIDGVHYSRIKNKTLSDNTFKDVKNLLVESLINHNEKIDVWRLFRMATHENADAAYMGVIHVSKGIVCPTPIRVVIKGSADVEDVIAPQIIVMLEEGAKCNISITLEGDGFFLPAVYVHAQKKAEIHYLLFQNTSIDSIVISSSFFKSETEAHMYSTSGQFGAMISVDNVYSIANGENSNLMLNGFYFGIKDQLFDLRVYQDHQAENTDSRALYHGVALEEAHTIFRGMIAVGYDAIDTDAYLTNNNLFLSETARMDSIPCLNINTNEVRCSHGSTTGDIDKLHIFYLMSRGFSKTEAKCLLVEGFLEKTFDPIFDIENKNALDIIKNRTVYMSDTL